jgi:hypothetical protein
MSIQTNFPAIKPSLLLDFSNTKQLDSRITFTRASTATYYGTQTAKAEENLLTRSQDINLWTGSDATASADTDAAPDGTTTADAVKENSATAVHRMVSPNLLALTASTVYTMSVFVKQKTGSRFATIGFNSDGSNYASATFDLSAGTNTQTLSAGYTSVSATITASVSSWYRVTLTATTNASAAASGLALIGLSATSTFASSSRGFDSYAGNNTSEILYWGAQLEQRSAATAYTPTTTATITNYVPQILTAASGVARFDHNPTTFESLGLEIEESRTNLVTYSSEFDNAAWTKTATTITANTVIAPDGALSGDLSVADTSSALHAVRATYTGTTTTTYSYSVYAKQASGSYEFVIHFGASSGTPTWSSGNRATVRFNLLTGVVVTTGSGVGNSTVISSSITPVGNGWYRCTFVFIPDTTGVSTSFTVGQIAAPTSQSVATAWTGDGYSGAYIWGAQLEAGAFPTSYIPTVASQVTRAADTASMTGTNFSSWYNQAQGTFYSEVIKLGNLNFQQVYQVNDGSSSNAMALGFGSSLHPLRFDVTTGGVSQAQITGIADTTALNTSLRTAAAYAVNDFAISGNGAAVATDTLGTVSVVNQLGIGYRTISTPLTLTGTIRKLSYYPIRCTNAQLQALTS